MQQFIGIGRPDSYSKPRKYTSLPQKDILYDFTRSIGNDEEVDRAFSEILKRADDFEITAHQEMGKRGLSRQDYEELFWENYLEHLSPDQLLQSWNARSSPRYHLMWEIHHTMRGQDSPLITFTQPVMEIFHRINGVLAINIINEIAGEVAKRKREKKKITPQVILDGVLQERNITMNQFLEVYTLATKSFLFKDQKSPHLVQLKKLLG